MADWITVSERPERTYFYKVTKKIDVPEGFKSFRANVSADTRYILRVNGKYVCEGPCLGSSYEKYYEEADLTPFVSAGENTIELKILHVVGNTFISAFRREKPAFRFSGDIDGLPVFSDLSWECVRQDGISFRNFPELIPSMPPFEEHFGGEKPVPMSLEYLYSPNENGYTVYGLADPYLLKKRPIPCMKFEKSQNFDVFGRGDGFIELDAGKYTTAVPTFDFRGRPGQKIDIIYAECAVEDGKKSNRAGKGMKNPVVSGAVRDTVYLPENGEYSFTPFWFRAFRFIRIEGDFELVKAEFAPYFYPLEITGSFKCSDENLNRMWDVSLSTVMCCAHETFVDCPYYEQQQYGMDSCLEMLFWLRMGNDPRLPFKCILDLAHSQVESGMLQANYPSTSTQIIPDFTLFWIIELREYLRYAPKTGVNENNLLGTVSKALAAFEPYTPKGGLIGMTPYWHFVDWVPGWDFGVPPGGREGEPLTFTSMLYCYALRAAAEIFEIFGNTNRAKEYTLRAEEMAGVIRSLCFDEEAGMFRNTPTRREFSQHTTVMAILADITCGEEAARLVDRTFSATFPVSVCSFSMNYFMFRALEKSGRYQLCKAVFSGWQKMLDQDSTTWCENPDDPRSECHGWSSAPIYEFSRMVLGVCPKGNNWENIEVKPDFLSLGLEFAEGSVPTPKGLINVSWKKTGDTYALSVNGKTYENCKPGFSVKY